MKSYKTFFLIFANAYYNLQKGYQDVFNIIETNIIEANEIIATSREESLGLKIENHVDERFLLEKKYNAIDQNIVFIQKEIEELKTKLPSIVHYALQLNQGASDIERLITRKFYYFFNDKYLELQQTIDRFVNVTLKPQLQIHHKIQSILINIGKETSVEIFNANKIELINQIDRAIKNLSLCINSIMQGNDYIQSLKIMLLNLLEEMKYSLDQESINVEDKKEIIALIDQLKNYGIINDSSLEQEKISEIKKAELEKIEAKIHVAIDSRVEVKVSDDKMLAYLIIYPPEHSGSMVDLKDLYNYLKNNGITFGINEEALKDAISKKRFYTYFLVAEGIAPITGVGARYDYHFQTNFSPANLIEDESGQIDYKNLKLIQNVVVNQNLATKIPGIPGTDGVNVFNEKTEQPDINDDLPSLGGNVTLSDDGLNIIATEDGYIKLEKNVISVETLYVIENDVDYNIGNIVFLGSVLVRGNVLDNFSIKASGDIEIQGTVGNCTIIGEGNILIHQGITGRSEANIEAGKNFFTRFIEFAKVKAENIIIGKEAFNSEMYANNFILCLNNGSRIIGGKAYACQGIIAQNIGSDVSIKTIAEIGIPIFLQSKKEKLIEELDKINNGNIELNKSFIHLKKKNDMSDTYKKVVQDLEYNIQMKKEINEELKLIQNEMDNYSKHGDILILDSVYPNVEIIMHGKTIFIKQLEKNKHYFHQNRKIGQFLIKKTTLDVIDKVNKTLTINKIFSSELQDSLLAILSK